MRHTTLNICSNFTKLLSKSSIHLYVSNDTIENVSEQFCMTVSFELLKEGENVLEPNIPLQVLYLEM